MYWASLNSFLRLSLLAAVLTPVVFADNVINVLWYTAGTTEGGSFATYESGVDDLASNAPNSASGIMWNITFWDQGTAPQGAYNVLVVASPQFIDGGDYSMLNAQIPVFGDRVLITGMDADWHYMNTPGPGIPDGPEGFLFNAVDWAAAGNGLGAVFLAPQGNVAWNFSGLGNEVSYDNLDNISMAPGTDSFPLNSGLTPGGLSNWSTSGKEAWDSYDANQWRALQVNGDDSAKAITLVSAATASDDFGTMPSSVTPEPSTAVLLSIAPAAVWMRKRKRRIREISVGAENHI